MSRSNRLPFGEMGEGKFFDRFFYFEMNYSNYSKTEKLRFAHEMACNPTPAESVLYRALSAKHIRFYKQYLMGGYIVDAYLPDKKIGIECDGGYHNELKQKIYDHDRDKILKNLNIKIMRFPNDQIMNDPIGVIESVVGKSKNKKQSRKISKSELRNIRMMNQRAKTYSSRLDFAGRKRPAAVISSGFYNK